MLSNLASYLLGYAEPAMPSPIEDTLRLTTVETEEDDWLIVERPEDIDEKEEEEVGRRRGSLPCLSLEESWFITPPPCFASTGPVRVETSPLENLLIEHPSMSVYTTQRAPMIVPEEQPPRARSLSPAPTPAHRHPSLPPTHHVLRLQLLTAQKHQNIKVSQALKRNHLERGNKVREVNNRNKRQTRKDRQKNHSGANNNRKCC